MNATVDRKLAFSPAAVFALAWAALCTPAPASAAATSHALLIAINDYAVPSIPDLRGAVNDVELVARVLETRLEFDRKGITFLKDSQATRIAILDAIDELVEKAGPDDRVYFHFSGHGSQAPDRDGDEDDELDETIVAYDSRKPGIPDITDDELNSRFARLRTRNVLLVFDSCHSGTVTRSISEIRTRAIPADDRGDLYQTTTRAAVAVETLPHVLMTGAPAHQQALDGPVDQGGFYGLFTYSLVRSLEANGPGASAEIVHEGVKQELRRIGEQWHMRPPEPQLEAPADMLRRPLFGGAATAPVSAGSTASAAVSTAVRRTWLQTLAIDADRVRLVDARKLNAQPGSQWALYGPGETEFRYGAALAVGAVESVSERDAVLRINVRRAQVPPDARAIAIAPPDLSGDVPVRLAGVTPERAAVLVGAIRPQVGIKPAGPSEYYRFLVELRAGAWHVIDAGGQRELVSFPEAADAVVAERLAIILRRSSRAMALLALENLASELKLWVGVQSAASASRPTAATRGIVLVSDDPAPAYRIRRPGEPRTLENSLIIEVQVGQPSYLTIVDVDAEGGVFQLFPTPQQRPGYLADGRVAANQLIRIPDSLAPGNAAGFYWDYAPPVGMDTVRVFATASLETAQTIRRYIAEASADSRALGALRAELAAGAVRGVRVSTDEAPATSAAAVSTAAATNAAPAALAGEWVAASVVIHVRE
ncbi:MAG: caspase family protein [Pseudomonadota bacterium]|nr:caspase family protein [Pseudomonadota bacterium]